MISSALIRVIRVRSHKLCCQPSISLLIFTTMLRLITLIVLMLCSSCCFPQFSRLSKYEKRWALLHPFAAYKVKKISKACYRFYNQPSLKQQLDTFSNGGQLDAFRHVFFMAAFAQKVSTKKLRQLGMAHEKANYRQFVQARQEEGEIPDSLGTEMDLKNNELGLTEGRKNRSLSAEELRQLVITGIRSGRAFIIKRNKAGNYVDCNDRVIDMKVYARKWNIPKCLVSSTSL